MKTENVEAFRYASKKTLYVLAASALVISSQLANAQTVLPADAKATCSVSAVEFAGWFTSGTVTANGGVEPADSVIFPNTPNCSFYKWSEQMFLWLTSPAPPKLGKGSHVFNSPVFYDVSPLENGKRTLIPNAPDKIRIFSPRISQVGPRGRPVAFDKTGKMFTVVRPELGPSGKPLIRNKAGDKIEIGRTQIASDGKPVFLDKAGKVIDHRVTPSGRPFLADKAGKAIDFRLNKITLNGKQFFLDGRGNVIETEQGQAGGGALIAQNGSIVYYALQVNDVYAYFATGAKNGGITPPPTRFPTMVPELNAIVAFGLAHSKTFPDANALAVELKSSWIETTGLDASKYVTITATIPTFDTSDATHWVANGTKQAQLALVGLHIVGSTRGHPEMIWSTFEHIDNTRNAQYTYTNTADAPITVPQNDAGTWLFSTNPPAATPNQQLMTVSGSDIVATSPPTPIGPSDVLRLSPWGSPGSSAAKNTEVIAINNSVIGMLAAGDVRKNYILIGSTWTIGGAPPNGSNEVGTNQLANSTMETFLQPSNCFMCHSDGMLGTAPGPDGFSGGLSHIWEPIRPLFP